jgi:hypothetical protein
MTFMSGKGAEVKGAWRNLKLMGIKIGHFGKYRTNWGWAMPGNGDIA